MLSKLHVFLEITLLDYLPINKLLSLFKETFLLDRNFIMEILE